MVDAYAPTRVAAVRALAEMPGSEALRGLTMALADRDEGVREATLEALASRPEPAAHEALLSAVGTHPDVRDDLGRSCLIQAILSLDGKQAEGYAERLTFGALGSLDLEEIAAFEVLVKRLPSSADREALASKLESALTVADEPARARARVLLDVLTN